MSIMSYTRNAKCADCRFCLGFKKGNMRRHKCDNIESEMYSKEVRLKDSVCSKWGL